MTLKVAQPTLWTWVRAVARRGFTSWHEHERWISISSYIAVIVLAGNQLFRSQYRQWIGADPSELISILALALLVFNLFLAAPFLLWKEAVEERNRLIDVTDYETVLDTLAGLLDEGNSGVLNARATNYPEWVAHGNEWMNKVENFLEKNFGIRERNLFKHIVVVDLKLKDGISEDHIWRRNIIAWKLLAIKEIILRHSDRTARWRADDT